MVGFIYSSAAKILYFNYLWPNLHCCYLTAVGRVGQSITASPSHRTVRDSLPSYGSYQSFKFRKKYIPFSNGRTGNYA